MKKLMLILIVGMLGLMVVVRPAQSVASFADDGIVCYEGEEEDPNDTGDAVE